MVEPENQSNRWRGGEDCQGPTGQRSEGDHCSGGVGADGMNRSETKAKREVSHHGESKPQPTGQAGTTGKTAGVEGDGRVLRSSDDPPGSKHGGEPREGTCLNVDQRSQAPEDGRGEGEYLFDRITTPPKVQKLQRTLYRKAKAEPKYRFFSLYGDVCRGDVLDTAMRVISANDGGPGIDGFSIQTLARNDEHWERWRAELEKELKERRYQPSPVLRKWIPKGEGKLRPLGVPTVKDRVVQAAMVLVLMPIFEADFHPLSFAYRPRRNAHQAMHEIKEGLRSGRSEVIDADLSGYFDTIPHDKLLKLVARRVSDGTVLALIKAWLRAPIIEVDPKTRKRKITPNDRGTPQGGVVSPLLANLYLDGLDKAVNQRCELKPKMIRYADDFVILCRKGEGQGLVERVNRWVTARGLKLNEKKTRVVSSQRENFKFLGFSVGWRQGRSGRRYVHVEPHAKSCLKLRERMREKLNHWTLTEPIEEQIKSVNRTLKGWAGYFRWGNYWKVFGRVQHAVNNRVRRWLWRKHDCRRGLYRHYTDELLHEKYGLLRIVPR